jgi:hypothetical protein
MFRQSSVRGVRYTVEVLVKLCLRRTVDYFLHLSTNNREVVCYLVCATFSTRSSLGLCDDEWEYNWEYAEVVVVHFKN